MTVKVRLDPTDCIQKSGVEYCVELQNDDGHVFRNYENPADRFEVRHGEVHAFLRREDVRLLRGHYSKSRKLLSLRTTQKFFSSAPDKARATAIRKLHWVQEFLVCELQGQVNRTEQSILDCRDEMNDRVNAKILADAAQAGEVPLCREAPSPRSLLEWVRTYEKGGHTVLALLRKERDEASYAQKFDRETVKIINEKLWDYLQHNRKSARGIARDIIDHFAEINEQREKDGMALLRVPSARHIERRIKRLSVFVKMAGRHGGPMAKRKMAIHMGGQVVHQPMQELQMDEWQFDVLTILDDAGCLEGLSAKQKQTLNLGRRWGYFAIDVATRCIVGFRLSASQNASHAIDALSMATIDKTHLAAAASCDSKWDQFGGGSVVATDMGPAFTAEDYLMAVCDAGFTPRSAAAGQPKLRGCIERVFGTFATQLMPELSGLVFSNPAERGDYPSEKLAALTDDDLVRVFTRFIVDIYHNTPHQGLNGETPANAWKRLAKEQGVMPPPDATARRVAFGIGAKRVLDRHGLRFLGNFYLSAELQEAYLKHGAHEVELKVDAGDITHVSVCLAGDWYSAKAVSDAAWGLSLYQWQELARQVRAQHKEASKVSEGVVRRARADIRKINSDAMTRRRLKPKIFDTDELTRLERGLFLGLELMPDRFRSPVKDAPKDKGLLGDVIPPKPTENTLETKAKPVRPNKTKLEFRND